MNSFDKLKEIFTEFPGIGPRQAERFAYFLLSRDESYIKEIQNLIGSIKKDVTQCRECMRYFADRGSENRCRICSDESRSRDTLMLVAKDNDLSTIEKSGAYSGRYFVLGGIIPILEKNPEKRVRLPFLERQLEQNKNNLKEIIFALSATHEGEHTAEFLSYKIKAVIPNIKISELGRGLSTGLEIEYSDGDTIKAALQNKKASTP